MFITRFNNVISDMAIDIYQVIKDEYEGIEDEVFKSYLGDILKYCAILVDNKEIDSRESLLSCFLYVLLNLSSHSLKILNSVNDNNDNIKYYKIVNSIFDIVNETYIEISNNK